MTQLGVHPQRRTISVTCCSALQAVLPSAMLLCIVHTVASTYRAYVLQDNNARYVFMVLTVPADLVAFCCLTFAGCLGTARPKVRLPSS